MSKAILRVTGIPTTVDLSGFGKHHIDRISATNKDIDPARSGENITLVKCTGNYNQMFDHVTQELQKQHEEQMKMARKSRQKSFRDKINSDKADVACEFMFSASPEYFEGRSREEVEQWARTSLDFVTEKIGIKNENVLHAVIHMDEKTPHLHVVAVPLVERYDGRKKEKVLAISRKQYINTRADMAQVQTDYVKHLNNRGFDLERGMEKSGAEHLSVARYKIKVTDEELEQVTDQLKKITTAKEKAEKEKRLLEKRLAELEERLQEREKAVQAVEKIFDRRLSLQEGLEDIESRTEPVKRLFKGKDKEAEVKLPQKDFKRLVELADRGIGAERLVSNLKAENTSLRNENESLQSDRDRYRARSHQAEDSFKELRSDLGKSRNLLSRLEKFVLSEGLSDRLDEWNKKRDRHQKQRGFELER